jgi:type I restriction enzyme S subunit
MQSEWPRRPLGELIVSFNALRKPVKEADRVTGPFPYYGASGVIDHVDGYLFDGEYLLIAEDGENLRTRSTPIAFRAVGKFWVNNHAHILRGNEETSTRFLEYAMLAEDIGPYLTGAVMPKLTQANLSRIEVSCPPREMQEEIVGILGVLDDRIGLLHQTNATLEATARAYFKSWFIDFDPVRAKIEGREPEGMDAETAALFPAAFEKSALGPIPNAWMSGTVDEVCVNPRTQVKPDQIPLDTPYIGLEHMPRKSMALDTAGVTEGIESAKFRFERDDILFGKLRPYFHKVGLAAHAGVCSTDILVLRPKDPAWLGFVAMLASSEALVSHATRLSNGARMPRTSWRDLADFEVVLPGIEVAAAFNRVTRPMFERIYANIALSESLSRARDSLLPRLISGKLRLPDVTEQVDAALA